MAIGERIRFFRNKKGVTQKYLGQVVGFPERSADVRMAQYETGSRTPKADLTRTLAGFFLNEELKGKGYITIAGRVNRQYFNERLYGARKEVNENASI